MLQKFAFLFLFLLSACVHSSLEQKEMTVSDPFLWLEEVEGEKALNWVKSHNQRTLGELQADVKYSVYEEQLLKIVNSKEKIPHVSIRGDYVYNFWQDETHVRGLWRRTSLAEYKKDQPQWDVILDFDQLAKDENENWVFAGSDCYPQDSNKCLVSLSIGGKDAHVIREFDVSEKSFVKDGFKVPEAKGYTEWLDQDTLLIGTDFGKGSLTDSGYPRVLKKWKRGTPLSAAETFFEGEQKDVMVWGSKSYGSGGNYLIVVKRDSFFTGDYFISRSHEKENLKPLPIQKDASPAGILSDQFLLLLHSDWEVQGQKFLKGDLVSIDLNQFFKTELLPLPQMVFSPTSSQAYISSDTTSEALLVAYLEHVKGNMLQFKYSHGQWVSQKVNFPTTGNLTVSSTNPMNKEYFVNYESFLEPASLYLDAGDGTGPQILKRGPKFFDSENMKVEQYFAQSKDGTKVPYFLVAKEGLSKTQPLKTLLYGYGGFRVPLLPNYSGSRGKIWLENDGVFVLANIRGGSEYGPRWHQEALLENRQKAYDDFIAVAEDLIARGITDSDHLGIMGGSNGGLLVGAVTVQRPELFKAVVCQVPLLDMLRYHKLLAGASWMGEYGNPEDPKMRPVLESYSPYQNLKEQGSYPKIFFVTSTKDDRVHPGHARKMAAKMESYDQPFFYYENIDGGHSAGANLKETARRWALEYVYLDNMLGENLSLREPTSE